jgi:hypothetical protein
MYLLMSATSLPKVCVAKNAMRSGTSNYASTSLNQPEAQGGVSPKRHDKRADPTLPPQTGHNRHNLYARPSDS